MKSENATSQNQMISIEINRIRRHRHPLQWQHPEMEFINLGPKV